MDRIGKDGFQPLCLTQYFATTHDCPPKVRPRPSDHVPSGGLAVAVPADVLRMRPSFHLHKAVLTTAFDDSWIQAGRKYRNSYHAKVPPTPLGLLCPMASLDV